jgi:competence protein ComGC
MPAFTLIETLISLGIVLAFTLLPVISFDKLAKQVETTGFIEGLEKEILFALSHSQMVQTTGEIQFSNGKVTFRSGEQKRSIQIPKHLLVSAQEEILITENGKITTFPLVKIRDLMEKKSYALQFQMGGWVIRKGVESDG